MNRLELIMRHYDGELDAEQSAEVERLLASDGRARSELAALQSLGGLVREAKAIPDIDVSSRIFARLGLEANDGMSVQQSSSDAPSEPRSRSGAASSFERDRLGTGSPPPTAGVERAHTPALQAPMRSLPPRAVSTSPRRIKPGKALAGVSLALALAAGFALWLARPVAAPVEILAGSSTGAVDDPDSEMAAPAPAVALPEPEPPEQSVAVERVDFGASQGAIFLVPSADERTLVVWTLDELTDDDEGEEADL